MPLLCNEVAIIMGGEKTGCHPMYYIASERQSDTKDL